MKPARSLLLTTMTIVAAMMAVLTTAHATIPGGFTQINLQDGGYVPVIIQHVSGRLYARTDGGGAYRSDDHGTNWTFLGGDFTSIGAMTMQGIAVPQSATSSSNLVLQATGASYLTTDPGCGLWKTTNGGGSWKQVLSGVNFSGGNVERTGGECLIFHPTNDLEAWAGSRGQGLWKSLDAGETWTEVGGLALTNVIIASICISPLRPDQVWVGGEGGLWLSLNHGRTWTQMVSNSLVSRVTCGTDGTIYFGGVNNGVQVLQIVSSTNWSNLSSDVFTDLTSGYWSGIGGNTGNPIVCLTVLRDGRLVAGDYDLHTRISSNRGVSFNSLPQTYVPGSVVPKWASASAVWPPNSLTQDVAATNTWYGGGGYGCMRTDNGGQTWQYIINGIGEVVTYKIAFHPGDPNRIYIPCGDHGGAIMTNGGFQNSVVSMATPFFAWPDDIVIYGHRALISTNNGLTRAIFPGGDEIYSVAHLYETTNDGAGWFKAPAAGLPTAGGCCILDAIDSADNPDDFLVVCGGLSGTNAAGIYRTTNGGATFTQSTGIPAGQMLGNQYNWQVSVDRDATNLNERYFYDAAVSNSAGFYQSLDRGATWTQQPWPLSPDWNGKIVADHGISGSLWVFFLPATNGIDGLAHSRDGGNTWSVVSGFSEIQEMDVLNGNICVYGQQTNDTWNKIYYSSNNGTSWDEITRPGHRFGNLEAVTCDPHRPGRVWISTNERSVGIFTPGTPAITNAVRSGANLTFSGSAGIADAGGTCSVLASTNVAPGSSSSWTVISTNIPLDGNGNFHFTGSNVLSTGYPAQFYQIRVP